MNEKKISIIIPVFNVDKYIDCFINSLEQQTINNFIAVFVDDKSTDNSLNILNSYLTKGSITMIVLQNDTNLGQGYARNIGLEYVKNNPTKYITFLDSDDWIECDYLEDLFNVAEEYDLDLCISGVERFSENDGKIICRELVGMSEKVYDTPEECHELALINPCLYSKLFKYDTVKDLRFLNMKRSEDTCFVFEALCKCKKVKFTNNAKYHYCVRNQSLTGKMSVETYLSMHEGFAKAITFFEEENKNIEDMFIAQVFIRSSIGGVCRVRSNLKKTIGIEKKELEFLDTYVPSWRRNCYLNFGKKKIGGIKGNALIICAFLYKMHLFFAFAIFYRFIKRIIRVEIRI